MGEMIDLDETVLLAEIREPELYYEYNEFVIRQGSDGVFWAGSDGGCSCYEGFRDENFQPFRSEREIRALFSAWVGDWCSGTGHEAAAWDQYHAAFRK
jgi:hypothetical protein